MERVRKRLRNPAHKFHGLRELTTWPADRESQRHTKPHSRSAVCQNCGWVEVDLALNILIPGTRWSETEKAKVSKLIGKRISFFPSSSLFVTVPLFQMPRTFPHSSGRKREDSRWQHHSEMLLLRPETGFVWPRNFQVPRVLQPHEENPCSEREGWSLFTFLFFFFFLKGNYALLLVVSLSAHINWRATSRPCSWGIGCIRIWLLALWNCWSWPDLSLSVLFTKWKNKNRNTTLN